MPLAQGENDCDARRLSIFLYFIFRWFDSHLKKKGARKIYYGVEYICGNSMFKEARKKKLKTFRMPGDSWSSDSIKRQHSYYLNFELRKVCHTHVLMHNIKNVLPRFANSFWIYHVRMEKLTENFSAKREHRTMKSDIQNYYIDLKKKNKN